MFENFKLLRSRIYNDATPSIAHYCDWNIVDTGFHGDLHTQPRSVYIKAEPAYLLTFFKRFYPLIHECTSFVLITGSSDRTIPQQIDVRYSSYKNGGVEKVLSIFLADKRITKWYAENCDTVHEKLFPLPIGCVKDDTDEMYQEILLADKPVSFKEKKVKALCSHYYREGDQWSKRRKVSWLAKAYWHESVDILQNVPYDKYLTSLAEYSFVICVNGGGLDPNPRLWLTLLAGSIPIIEKSTLSNMYEEMDLPVVIVDKWDRYTIDQKKLEELLHKYRHYQEDHEYRAMVLYKLSMEYWREKIGI